MGCGPAKLSSPLVDIQGEDVVAGLEKAPAAVIGLVRGDNLGKRRW